MIDSNNTNKIEDNVEIVRDTYESIAQYFPALLTIENSSEAEVSFVDRFIERLPSNGLIADLGCGAGKHGRYCAKKGFRVIGYDISKNMIRYAEEKNSPENGEMKFLRVADMRSIESKEMFDGVIMMYSLIHLTKEQAVQTLKNTTLFMKDGALILISVYLGERDGLYIEPLNLDKQQYFRDYKKKEIVQLLTDVGFAVKDEDVVLWNDEDPITASNDENDFGVIGIIAALKR